MKPSVKKIPGLKKPFSILTGFLIFVIFAGFVLTVDRYFMIFDRTDFGGEKFLLLALNIVFSITIISTIVLVILENGHPPKTIAWILILILFPLIGILFYLYFGRNYRKHKIFSTKELTDLGKIESLSIHQIIDLNNEKLQLNPYIESKGHIMKLLIKNSKSLLTEKNKVDILNNGKATFKSIIQDLKKAKHFIHVEYYMLEDDKIGNEIKDILIAKAKEGVEVRIIYDEVGSWELSRQYKGDLKRNGVEMYPFLPVRFPLFANKLNYRNHRKIIVIDGFVGFVGGINIADRYIEGSPELGFWRDTHLRIEGDAVHSLQAVFLIDWLFVSEQLLSTDVYFPDHLIKDNKLVQITASGPDTEWASIMQAYFMAISTAKKYIYLSTPYFMPNESILTALKTVALSGIKVVLLLPEKADFFLYTWTTNSYLPELVAAGIEVYIYKKGFTHSKIFMVDGEFSSVGTANVDVRSFDQNFEIIGLIYDREITEKLEESFKEDLKFSYKVSSDELLNRSVIRKFRESVARIFTHLL